MISIKELEEYNNILIDIDKKTENTSVSEVYLTNVFINCLFAIIFIGLWYLTLVFQLVPLNFIFSFLLPGFIYAPFLFFMFKASHNKKVRETGHFFSRLFGSFLGFFLIFSYLIFSVSSDQELFLNVNFYGLFFIIIPSVCLNGYYYFTSSTMSEKDFYKILNIRKKDILKKMKKKVNSKHEIEHLDLLLKEGVYHHEIQLFLENLKIDFANKEGYSSYNDYKKAYLEENINKNCNIIENF